MRNLPACQDPFAARDLVLPKPLEQACPAISRWPDMMQKEISLCWRCKLSNLALNIQSRLRYGKFSNFSISTLRHQSTVADCDSEAAMELDTAAMQEGWGREEYGLANRNRHFLRLKRWAPHPTKDLPIFLK